LFTSPFISRLAALLILVIAMMGGYTFVVEPIIIGYGETNRQIDEVHDQLGRFERAAAMRPAIIKQMKEFEAQRKSLGYFLMGSTDAVAAAGLQDQIHTLIDDKGGTLHSVQPMPGVEEDGLTRITLQVQMSGTTDTLLDVLYALEFGNPILFVDDLDIQNRDIAADPGAQDGGILTVSFDLSGYLPKGDQ
jgi:general secretion pathway protein M